MIQAFLQLVMWFVMNRFSVLSKITVNLRYVVCLLEIKFKKIAVSCLRSYICLRSLKGSVYIYHIYKTSIYEGG